MTTDCALIDGARACACRDSTPGRRSDAESAPDPDFVRRLRASLVAAASRPRVELGAW